MRKKNYYCIEKGTARNYSISNLNKIFTTVRNINKLKSIKKFLIRNE